MTDQKNSGPQAALTPINLSVFQPTEFDTALGAERHQLLTRRLCQLYGALELARLFEYGRLARRIETQVDACRRNIEAD